MKGAELYRNAHSFEKRRDITNKIMSKFIDRIPVLVFSLDGANTDKPASKFVVRRSDIFFNFIRMAKDYLKDIIQPDEYSSTFVFVEKEYSNPYTKICSYNHMMPNTSETMGNIYNTYVNPDGFLYLYFGKENVYG